MALAADRGAVFFGVAVWASAASTKQNATTQRARIRIGLMPGSKYIGALSRYNSLYAG